MPFGLTIGTERATALQQSIQDELTRRGYSPDADPVMAEYITIMIINNKTAAQITSELEDLIGSEFDPSFTDWLFAEAAKGVSDSPSQPQLPISEQPSEQISARDLPPHIVIDSSRRPPNAPRSSVYQQALSQALPSTTPSAQKRSASARSPSPSHPNKSRRTDVPTGPRAMFRDGNPNPNPNPSSRSLLDRVGGPAGPIRNGSNNPNGFPHDDIQARIDNIVNSSPDPNMMMAGGFPGMGVGGVGMPGMDMNAMATAGMANPLMLQEMMMNQMAMMAQMASSMGMINPATGQFGGQGFPMQGVMPGDVGTFGGGGMNGFQGSPQMGGNAGINGSGRGRGSGRGGRGMGRRGGQPSSSAPKSSETQTTNEPVAPSQTLQIATPTPTPAVAATAAPSTSVLSAASAASQEPQQRTGFVLPERPQSPTLCKFGLKCINAHCRYSHPSPVATAESGVVLSNEACDKGKDCKDKDCVKAHVSPAVLNPQAEQNIPTPNIPPVTHQSINGSIPCRFGAACTRTNCTYTHPTRPSTNHNHSNHFAQQCRFGAGCTRGTCPFQHPEGRVLPTTFHRGLSTSAPMVTVQTPEAGSMGGPSPHRSVTFNNSGGIVQDVKEKLANQMREIEEKKSEVANAVKEAEAAANKKEESKPVAIAA